MGKDELQLAVEPTLPIQIQTDGETNAFSDFAQFLEKSSLLVHLQLQQH